ncbi:MAG: hypothetical protein FJW31_17515 [Acidobacteria bacterium]|nr:hypothetical protein [Acidobacteriota bacterium]
MTSLLLLAFALEPAATAPVLHRLEPFGGTRGATAEVALAGKNLQTFESVWFDTPDLRWANTTEVKPEQVRGRIEVAPGAALGPHLLYVRTRDGRTNSRLFNVLQFSTRAEAEPNDRREVAQPLTLQAQVVTGYLPERPDVDFYRFTARAGERWLFDLRSMEYGSHLECDMTLLDQHGKQVAFNDDRDEYLETPLLEHTFASAGTYYLKLDQYRGPQGVNCGSNCGYLLEISQLHRVESAYPLGAAPGAAVKVELTGTGLAKLDATELRAVRLGEYYRLTFPFTIPVHARPDQPVTISGHLSKGAVSFALPASAPTGLYRLWTHSPTGWSDSLSFQVATPSAAERIIDGQLTGANKELRYPLEGRRGQPIHAYTLAAQLGLPAMDTVLELFDARGKLLAEHDDLMSGQGTVIGNPDSSLYYTPAADGPLELVVRDRIGRVGPGFSFRLHIRSAVPGFALLAEPEEFSMRRGAESEYVALLIKEPGFAEAVDVWFEGLPPGVTAERGRFRADQVFGPSGDGDNVLIPEVLLKVRASANAAPGEHPVRLLGRRVGGGEPVEAFTTVWIGPPGKRNDVRRPVPAVTITVR